MGSSSTTDSPLPTYRLDQWATMRMQLIWAYEKRMHTNATLAASTHNFQAALLVREGWAEVGNSLDSVKRVEPGQWIFVRQGKRLQRFSEGCTLLSIGYRFQSPTGEALYEQGLPLCVESDSYPALYRAARRVLREVRHHIGEGFFLRRQQMNMEHFLLSQNALRIFLIELAKVFADHAIHPQTAPQNHPQVNEALTLIDEALANPHARVNATSIASQVKLSPAHLDRLMVAETGRTVFQQMEARRLVMAEDALIGDQSSLKVIAYELGFSSPSHFNSWFKQRVGTTPLQYRKENT